MGVKVDADDLVGYMTLKYLTAAVISAEWTSFKDLSIKLIITKLSLSRPRTCRRLTISKQPCTRQAFRTIVHVGVKLFYVCRHQMWQQQPKFIIFSFHLRQHQADYVVWLQSDDQALQFYRLYLPITLFLSNRMQDSPPHEWRITNIWLIRD